MARKHLLAVVLIIVGCGGGDEKPATHKAGPPRLSALDSFAVASAEADLARNCLNVVAGEIEEKVSVEEVVEAPNTLVNVFRKDPDAIYGDKGDKRTMRQVLVDVASDQEQCDPDVTARLDRELDAAR